MAANAPFSPRPEDALAKTSVALRPPHSCSLVCVGTGVAVTSAGTGGPCILEEMAETPKVLQADTLVFLGTDYPPITATGAWRT